MVSTSDEVALGFCSIPGATCTLAELKWICVPVPSGSALGLITYEAHGLENQFVPSSGKKPKAAAHQVYGPKQCSRRVLQLELGVAPFLSI